MLAKVHVLRFLVINEGDELNKLIAFIQIQICMYAYLYRSVNKYVCLMFKLNTVELQWLEL